MNKLIQELKKELLCSPSTKATIADNIITLDDHQCFAYFEINPSETFQNPMYEEYFYIDDTEYHIVQIYPI